eukprot:287148_1
MRGWLLASCNNCYNGNQSSQIFLATNALSGNIKQFLRVYTRSEVLGCAEGRVEGDVKKMGNRLRNRTRLNDVIFGLEHTTTELLRVYKYRLLSSNGEIGLFRKMAREYKRLYPSK